MWWIGRSIYDFFVCCLTHSFVHSFSYEIVHNFVYRQQHLKQRRPRTNVEPQITDWWLQSGVLLDGGHRCPSFERCHIRIRRHDPRKLRRQLYRLRILGDGIRTRVLLRQQPRQHQHIGTSGRLQHGLRRQCKRVLWCGKPTRALLDLGLKAPQQYQHHAQHERHKDK